MTHFSIKPILILVMTLCFMALPVHAEEMLFKNTLYFDKAKVVSQQINLLQDRLSQAQNELTRLQQEEDHPTVRSTLNKRALNQAKLDIAVAKSNLDSVTIELVESQQTISRLEKETQEIENQLNVYNMFSAKASADEIPNLGELQHELQHEKNLLQLEKTRATYLRKLQGLALNSMQVYKARFATIEAQLKSQLIAQLKEQQAKSEITFQQQQSYWLQQLNGLYKKLNTKGLDKAEYAALEDEIFYANENVNFTYLQMLIARYQDQIQQLQVSITRTSSVTQLNKVTEQAQVLGKQLVRVDTLLKARLAILAKRNEVLLSGQNGEPAPKTGLADLDTQYKIAINTVASLNQDLAAFRTMLEQALKQELSARQGLPGWGTKAWLDLGAELFLLPSLAFQVVKSLAHNTLKAIHLANGSGLALLILLEFMWISVCYYLNHFLARIVFGVPDHEYGHINLKWLLIKVFHRNLFDIAIIGNLAWLFYISTVPVQNYSIVLRLGLVWVVFKGILTVARLCLVETTHDTTGHDVRLFHALKWSFSIGALIMAFTVFVYQLPLIYEIKDLLDRILLLFLLVISIFLLKSWEVLPGLILPHVDERHTYVKRVIRLLCLSIPLILLINSLIGLFGYVNLVLTFSWFESVFLLVLVGYLFIRGLFNDAMNYISQLLIQHIPNGWLWTEAFLKPLDKIFRVILFLLAWAVLFHFYGWDNQSPVVRSLNNFLHYDVVDILNTSVTPIILLELLALIYFLCWAARWTREFVYRLLLSRTKDLGIRNSIAILSQYLVILIGLFICLRVLGIDFRALAVVAGAFAFGVGLGLRDLANNFVCGFLLLLERPLRVGDTVSIGTYEGEVMHIGGRAVTIRTWDYMDVLVPNADIFSKSFTNWTAKDHVIRSVITIKIDKHDKPQDVQAIIYQVLSDNKNVLAEPAAEVFLKELSEGLIELEVRYFINLRQVRSRIGVRSEVLIAVWEAFEKHGISPPYPHREVFLKSLPEKLDGG